MRAHGEKADRQHRHALVPAVIRGQIEPPAPSLEHEDPAGESRKPQPRRQPHQETTGQGGHARAVRPAITSAD